MGIISFEDINNDGNYTQEEISFIGMIVETEDNLILTDYLVKTLIQLKNGKNICCVGPGGTGKSTGQKLSSYIYKDEEILRLAPTGMAALNMHETAKTIHSILKIGEKSLLAYDWQKVKREIIKKKDLIKQVLDPIKLIIFDEFSMIISGLFDTFIRVFEIIYNNDSSVPLNGTQVLFMGDILQLPPVKNNDAPYIDETTRSRVLDKDDYLINNGYFKTLIKKENIIHYDVNLRLNDIDDQETIDFNNFLTHSRKGFHNCSEEELDNLMRFINSRRRRGSITQPDDENYNLYTHSLKTTLKNDTIDEINEKKLNKLIENGNYNKTFTREFTLTKELFRNKYSHNHNDPDKRYDSIVKYMDNLNGYKQIFTAVVDERVMLRCNNMHERLKNGSLGTIKSIDVNSISVLFDGFTEEIDITINTWTHPEYSDFKVNAFPLIPAWAITIHKLQGQTINSPLFILLNDMKDFPHLLYTAISRVTTIKNLFIIINNPIIPQHFPVNTDNLDWYNIMIMDQ